jgi:hypothetical protein
MSHFYDEVLSYKPSSKKEMAKTILEVLDKESP